MTLPYPGGRDGPDACRGISVALRAVTKAFGEAVILDEIDLSIGRGEFLSVVGASGCGKTTLLNLVAGFIAPTRGTITVDGRNVSKPGADRATVFQDDAVFPWATVLDNVAFGLRLRGVPRKLRREQAMDLVHLVGLTGREHAYPRELSGGMRKRVDVARALAVEPEVLLMDEPFAALDAITKERLQEEFLRIHDERSTTVVFVTHDLEEALFLSDRVVLMGQCGGRIVADVRVPFRRPRTVEVRTDPRLQDLRSALMVALRDEQSARENTR